MKSFILILFQPNEKILKSEIEDFFDSSDALHLIETFDKFGNTPLIDAVLVGNLMLVDYLINHGANVDHLNGAG